MVSARVYACLKLHFILPINKIGFHFKVHILLCFLHKYLLLFKFMEVKSQSLPNISSSLKHVDSQVKHCSPVALIISSLVTRTMRVLWIVELYVNGFYFIFIFFDNILKHECAFMKSGVHSNKDSVSINLILS